LHHRFCDFDSGPGTRKNITQHIFQRGDAMTRTIAAAVFALLAFVAPARYLH
jgi:hypothetical protein